MSGAITTAYERARSCGWHLVGGRRRYNAQRQFLAALRRVRLVQMLHETGLRRGFQAELAKRLGVQRWPQVSGCLSEVVPRVLSSLGRRSEQRSARSKVGGHPVLFVAPTSS
jgi:hypothetical protein